MIKQFIIKNLLSIHSGGVGGKIWASIKLAVVPAAGLSLSEKLTGWYIERETYILILAFSLIDDLILGVWKHLENHSFTATQSLLTLCNTSKPKNSRLVSSK
ncbi:hypothetical protein SAMN05443633_1302 [Chryseobacterium arachidis]|uniref:Uncharacterized protein n=1 Tax=Chryseobacterium arachidis TaxID=1416778 RepID=A0A1M5MZU6_9FLAO|nr:hypothetical protein [Chryseobacterium arachidis]SHG82856.1 hypothetical protein SAMN05443633_1302 [Chryseobacterium arachidis]